MKSIKESDWKIFKEIKTEAIESFCQNAINEFESALSDNGKSNYEKYLHHYKQVKNTDKKMARLFDGHSRSKAHMQLLSIRSEGLANIELVQKLSEEFQGLTDPKRFNW